MNSATLLVALAVLALLAHRVVYRPEAQIRLYECRMDPPYVTPRPSVPCTEFERLASRVLAPLVLDSHTANILTIGDMYLEIVAMAHRCIEVWTDDEDCTPPSILACVQLWRCSRGIVNSGGYQAADTEGCTGDRLAIDLFSFELVMSTLRSGGNLTQIVEELPLSACCLAEYDESEKDTLESRLGSARQANPLGARV